MNWLLFLGFVFIVFVVSVGQVPCGNGDIRLVGGMNRFEGRIEVCWFNEWGTVCDDRLSLDDIVAPASSQQDIDNFANVVCRQLGLTAESVTTARTTEEMFERADESVRILLDNVRCNGDESGIIECEYNPIGSHDCDHSEDTGIICGPGCIDHTIRLVDNGPHTTGLVQLCYKESWTTISESSIVRSPQVATVICRQLGFSDIGAVPLTGGTPGVLYGQILNFDCEGNEMQLSECRVSLSPYNNYNHTDDAGVRCERCVDRCDLGSTRDACITTEAFPTTEITERETETPRTDFNNDAETTENIASVADQSATCSNNETILGAIVGILIVILIAVIIGWIVTCFLLKSQTKGEYTVNFDAQMERRNESDTAFHNRAYEDIPNPTSTTAGLEMSGQFTPNESYAKVSHLEVHTTVPTSTASDVDNSYADPYEMRDVQSNDSDMLDNPLYEVLDESRENPRSIDPNEQGYSVLDRERTISEDPVESRPRKNIATTDDEYSKLER